MPHVLHAIDNVYSNRNNDQIQAGGKHYGITYAKRLYVFKVLYIIYLIGQGERQLIMYLLDIYHDIV